MTIIFQRPDIDSQTRRLTAPLNTSLALYTASFVVSALLARYLFHYAVAPSIAMTLVYGLGLIILYAGQQRLGWIGAWLCICALFFYILSGNDFAFKQYGDAAFYQAWVAQGYVHNRWMLGMALENELYAVVKSLSSFHLFSEFTITPHKFCQFVSWGCMSGATLYLLKKFPGKTALTFCTLTPLWLTLTAGYIEYYPLIAALLPCLLAYLLYSEKMTTNTYWLIGLASAILAAAYIGFIPIAAIVLVYFLLRQPANFIVLFLGAFVSFAIITQLFYESPAHYLSSLPASMNLGDTNSVVQYRGLAASDSSIFFKTSYALSWQHAKELLRMYFVAGGLVHLSALLYILIANFKSLPKLLLARHNALLTAITAWLWFYFIFMIPKLGPVQDVDLFFATYIVTAFFLGHCIDALPHINKKRIYALIAGNAALSFYLLSVVGIDKISA